MKKHYFLGLAAGRRGALKQLLTHGSWRDLVALEMYLQEKYEGEAMLCKNGRSALTLALKAYFEKGDKIIVNGFTCYAVYEAVKAAGLTPVWADISKKDLNFDLQKLQDIIDKDVSGIIIQNTLGNPADIAIIEKLAEKYDLTIIEDLAHSAGVKYTDGREVGTVGAATVLSFGKDKAIDTISGGAVIFREVRKIGIKAPNKSPKVSDFLRARWYPMFGAICRGLSYVHLGGVVMRGLVAIHWVEKSADNRLDLTRRPAKFETKLALEQLKKLKRSGEPPLREFYLVRDKAEVLRRLRKAGYYFDGLWYEKPVSPARYYKRVHFPENECPVAVEVSEKIVNLPTYYSKKALEPARKIIREYLDEEECE